MAKLFKQLPALGQGVPAKPLSELDFLDLLGEPGASSTPLPAPVIDAVPPANLPVANEVVSDANNTGGSGNPLPSGNSGNGSSTTNPTPSKQSPAAGNASNTGKTVNAGKSSKHVKPGKAVVLASPVEPPVTAGEGDVRHTFVLSKNHLEQLRDLVHARRTAGDYAYSQKQAVQEALQLLFAANGLAAPRSEEARAREQQHRELMKKGRQLRADGELPLGSNSSD